MFDSPENFSKQVQVGALEVAGGRLQKVVFPLGGVLHEVRI